MENWITASDGSQLLMREWMLDDPAALVLIVHGLAEHSGRYNEVAAALNSHQFAVVSYDHRGHGRSPGRRAHIDSMDRLVEDLACVVDHLCHTYDAPLFLMGHSMGGAITLRYVLGQSAMPVRGIILNGAAIKLPDDLAPALRPFASALSALAPRLPTVRMDPNALSSDPAVVKDYLQDPLTYTERLPARTGAEMLRVSQTLQKQLDQLDLPVLFLHGTDDTLTTPEGSVLAYEQAASADKTLKLYEGFRHETFRESGGDRVIADIIEWLTSRLSRARATEA